MVCRITDLQCKDVINICDGHCIGRVDDVEVDTLTALIVAIVVRGRAKCFGLFGREEDIVIPWCEIKVIGEDAVLVDPRRPIPHRHRPRKPGFFNQWFG